MGQKINPTGFRVGIIKDWESRWYSNAKDFGDTLVEDYTDTIEADTSEQKIVAETIDSKTEKRKASQKFILQ